MPVTVSHSLSMTTPDNPSFECKPSDWNNGHLVTINAVGSEISGAFGNGGGVSFGLSADGKITASAPAGGGGLTNINVSAGSTSNNLSAFEFSNGNGVTFGLNGSTITATVATNYQSQGAYLTTAMASNRGTDFVQATAAFAGTNASGTIASNGISVSVGNYITTARASNDAVGLNTALTAGPLAWTVNSNGLSLNAGSAAGTTTGFAGNSISGSMTHNTAGLNVSLAHPAWLTTAMQSNAATISNVRVSAGTTSNLLSAITFSNSNGVSFGINGSTMTASHNGLTTAALSDHSHGNPTLNLTNLSGTTASNSAGFTLSLSAAAPGGGGTTNQTGPNIAAGGVTVTDGTVVFSNSNGVSFGLAGSTMTASVQDTKTYSGINHYNDLNLVAGQYGQGTLQFDPVRIENYVQMDRFCIPVINTNSSNSSGSHTLSFWVGIYTRNASTLSLWQSASGSTAVTHSGTVGSYSLYSGIRLFTIPFTTTFSPDDYWIGFVSRTTTGGANGSYSNLLASNIASNYVGFFGSSHNTTQQFTLGQGVYTATTSGIPGSIGFSQIRGSDSAQFRPAAIIMAYSTV